jgi:predicted Holliday junction resolvase-like endonuclease
MHKKLSILLLLLCLGCVPGHYRQEVDRLDAEISLVETELQTASEPRRATLEAELDTLIGQKKLALERLSDARTESIRKSMDITGATIEGLAPIAGIFLPCLVPLLTLAGRVLRRQ